MTNAIPQVELSELTHVRPMRSPPEPPQELEACVRGFLAGFGLHARPEESACARCRRLVRVLQPEAGALPEAALEVLRGVAVVAEIAVETRLRALLAQSNCPAAVTWPPLDRGYQVPVVLPRTNPTENP